MHLTQSPPQKREGRTTILRGKLHGPRATRAVLDGSSARISIGSTSSVHMRRWWHVPASLSQPLICRSRGVLPLRGGIWVSTRGRCQVRQQPAQPNRKVLSLRISKIRGVEKRRCIMLSTLAYVVRDFGCSLVFLIAEVAVFRCPFRPHRLQDWEGRSEERAACGLWQLRVAEVI